MSEGNHSRPGLIILGIIIVVAGGAGIYWLGSGSGALPSDKLIEHLKTGTPTQQVTAAEALGKLNDRAALDPLIGALANKEWAVRRAAAKALGDLRDGRAVPPLVERLEDDTAWVVIAAAQSLVKIGDASAIGPMEKRLEAEKKKKKDKQNADLITLTEEAVQKLKSK